MINLPEARTNLFIFTATCAAAARNLEVSMWRAIPADLVRQYFGGQPAATAVYGWGIAPTLNNARTWGKAQPGDWLLGVAEKNFVCGSKILSTQRLPGLARSLWGTFDGSHTWELLLLVTPPSRISVPIEQFSSCLHRKYQGFTRVGDDRIDAIETAYGSLDHFVASLHRHDTRLHAIGRADLLCALAEFDRAPPPGYKASTNFELVHEGRSYPPRAVFALAAKRVMGRLPAPDELQALIGGSLFRTLRSLGFSVGPRRVCESRVGFQKI